MKTFVVTSDSDFNHYYCIRANTMEEAIKKLNPPEFKSTSFNSFFGIISIRDEEGISIQEYHIAEIESNDVIEINPYMFGTWKV
jgi:hypothetical protein